MGIKYCFTTKDDGNLAFHTTEDKKSVEIDREKAAIKYGFSDKKLIYMNQTHGSNIEIVDENSPDLIENCDAIITKSPNIVLMVMVADCIPIVLYDEKQGVFSAIHAGRNSTFLGISKKTAEIFIEKFNSNPDDIRAVFGASIQKCCYEVSPEMAKIVEKSFGKEFVKHRNIDLQSINRKQLESLGVKNIEISNICTKCGEDNYFSYRKDKNAGRFAAFIWNRVLN